MPISAADKEDVISTVVIELERFFTILSIRFPPDRSEQALLLEKIEAAFRASLKSID